MPKQRQKRIIILRSVKKKIRKQGRQNSTSISRHINLLRSQREQLGMPYSKQLEANLYELRINGNVPFRLFYTFLGDRIVIFHGFVKKRNKILTHEWKTIRQKLQLIQTMRI